MQCPAVGLKLRSVPQVGIGTLDHYTDRRYIVFQYPWVYVSAKSYIEKDALQVFRFNQWPDLATISQLYREIRNINTSTFGFGVLVKVLYSPFLALKLES